MMRTRWVYIDSVIARILHPLWELTDPIWRIDVAAAYHSARLNATIYRLRQNPAAGCQDAPSTSNLVSGRAHGLMINSGPTSG
jgi:hypothetical protein